MLRVVCLPGDGIGPEVTAVAIDVLRALPIEIELEDTLRRSRDQEEGTPLPERTLEACRRRRRAARRRRPPRVRGAPVRPSRVCSARVALSTSTRTCGPPAPEVDLLIVRELVGGLYFGAQRPRDRRHRFDTCEYTPPRSNGSRGAASSCGRRGGARDLRRQGERARDLTALARELVRVVARTIRTSSSSTCWSTRRRCSSSSSPAST